MPSKPLEEYDHDELRLMAKARGIRPNQCKPDLVEALKNLAGNSPPTDKPAKK